ncbi:MAG: insulinase family protein [Bacteroidales bacterium]|jgi:zinc protease|nr:insulinase family protein [Bacteroidales bacterium]
MNKGIVKSMFLVVCMLWTAVWAQDVNAPINNDPNVKIGKLENGMTYYIRANKKPEKKVEFRLAVNAGSMQENDDQQGLAHFTEHMGFNGIKGYPGNAVVSELQKIGVSFGADLNAYTSFDQTVYMIQLPSDDPKYLNLGFDILYGWAAGMLMDDKEIDKERGVIIEEWRMRLGANDRMQRKYYPVLMNNSRYAERMPIGKVELLKTFKPQVLKDFYKDWYRPDLQAIIIVGDIDVNATEAKIKEMMSGIQMPANPRKKEIYPIPMRTEPAVVICTDKEAPATVLFSYKLFPNFKIEKVGDYKTEFTHQLYNTMFDARFSEISQNPDCPFIGASEGYGDFIGVLDAYGFQIVCKENRTEDALKRVIQEEHRVKKYGFLESELKRAKEVLMERYKRAEKEVDKTESATFTWQYISHYLEGDPIPGAKRLAKFAEKFVAEITLEEVNALAEVWLKENNAVVVLQIPEKEGIKVPTEDGLLKIMTDPQLANVEPYVDDYKETDFVDPDKITAGKIVSERNLDEIGAKELMLSNGVKVILKKTEFKNDEIVMSARSKGGYSLYPPEDIVSAQFANEFVDNGGIADMDVNSLHKKMQGKRYGLMPYIYTLGESFDGSASPDDLETYFQYLHAYFTNIRIDTSAYKVVMDQMLTQIKMIAQMPMYKMLAKLMDVSTQKNPYASNILTMGEEGIKKADFNRAVQIFRERFANPADFVFTFVGNFDETLMRQYLEKYVASLPTQRGQNEFYRDAVLADMFPTTQQSETIISGTEDQSWVGIAFSHQYPYSNANNMIATQIGDAIDIELLELIREKMGGVYSPIVQADFERHPKAEWALMIAYACAPKKVEKITAAALKFLKNFQKTGPKPETLEKVKKQLINSNLTRLESNNFWKNYISGKYFEDEQAELNLINSYEARVNAVTMDDIKKFLQENFDPNHYVRVTLLPENVKKKK